MKEKTEKTKKERKPRSSKKQDSDKKPRSSKKQDTNIPLPDREIKPALKPKENLPNLTNIIHDNVVTKMKKVKETSKSKESKVKPDPQKQPRKVKTNPTVCYFPDQEGLPLTAADLEFLCPGQWLTDQVVALEVSRLEDKFSPESGGIKIFDSVLYQKLLQTTPEMKKN